MNISKTKINVALGSLTGLLIGVVFGITLSNSDSNFGTSGAASGNVSLVSRHLGEAVVNSEEKASIDTVYYTVIDESGETWKVTMTR